jgi:hypothetical protein
LIPPGIQIKSGEKADKAVRDFTARTASAYRLSRGTVTLSDLHNDMPGLERLINDKRRLRKLWQVTRDPACKTEVNSIATTIRRMTRRKALQRWETKVGICEVTPQAMWPIAKSLMKGMQQRNRPLFVVL